MKLKTKELIVKYVFLALIIIGFLVFYLCNMSDINHRFQTNFIDKDNYKQVFIGLKNTLIITIGGFAIGIILGFITCLVEGINSTNWLVLALKQIFKIYVSIFRGTPMMVQLLIIYFIVFASTKLNDITISFIAFGLNSGAYVSEIIRGGINAVPQGQMEAGRSLGLSYSTVMIKIIFPQAIKNCLPSLGNELITLFKDTSIVGFIGAFDLTLAFKKIGNASFDYVFVYLLMGITYFILVYIITKLLNLVERKLINNAI